MVSYIFINEERNVIVNTVKIYGTCARINVPVSWIGKWAKVTLLDKNPLLIDDEEEIEASHPGRAGN